MPQNKQNDSRMPPIRSQRRMRGRLLLRTQPHPIHHRLPLPTEHANLHTRLPTTTPSRLDPEFLLRGVAGAYPPPIPPEPPPPTPRQTAPGKFTAPETDGDGDRRPDGHSRRQPESDRDSQNHNTARKYKNNPAIGHWLDTAKGSSVGHS